ncbi:hypothetical protein GCM10007380_40640 [Gottfriedia solisilvae]|uniref:Uncharacterized protein n=2 Tax=Gottfriedia solisilvae TaxID=1516104 RepID=A0A8J3ASE8_9BACI|nr:hypothetical protein GCM10007380_40640 [Gottfriedia solisilvae]
MTIFNNYYTWFFKRKVKNDLSELITTSIVISLVIGTGFFNFSLKNYVIPLTLTFIAMNVNFIFDDFLRNLLGRKNKEIPKWIFGIVFGVIVVLTSVMSSLLN